MKFVVIDSIKKIFPISRKCSEQNSGARDHFKTNKTNGFPGRIENSFSAVLSNWIECEVVTGWYEKRKRHSFIIGGHQGFGLSPVE